MANEGLISRAAMEQAIKDGGSVLHGGQIHTSVASLPDDAVLAAGDPEKTGAALDDIEGEIAKLEAKKKRLQESLKPAPAKDAPKDEEKDKK